MFLSSKPQKAHQEKKVIIILAIWRADPFGPISTKIGAVVGVNGVIIPSNFGFSISGVSDFQVVEFSVFPLSFLVTSLSRSQ